MTFWAELLSEKKQTKKKLQIRFFVYFWLMNMYYEFLRDFLSLQSILILEFGIPSSLSIIVNSVSRECRIRRNEIWEIDIRKIGNFF